RAVYCVKPLALDKETVFEWFGLHLNPAKRIEFMCGLLHMCQPLELRFLGSYLEDLARKDYHVLRDFEFRANSPSDLGVLTDVVDPVVRSKLLVCLSLLGSDSRECAGILFRILSHVDPALFYTNYDCSLPPFGEPRHHPLRPPCRDGDVYGRSQQTCGSSANETTAGPLEQLALLFAMASLHPAFHFHQREMVRGQLDKIELAIKEEERRLSRPRINAQITVTSSHRRESRYTLARHLNRMSSLKLPSLTLCPSGACSGFYSCRPFAFNNAVQITLNLISLTGPCSLGLEQCLSVYEDRKSQFCPRGWSLGGPSGNLQGRVGDTCHSSKQNPNHNSQN
uniref:Zinc finger CCHC domain-containing protein 2 n=1 Tax=Cyclopterus lumpus TaxID=8103 RepID=A0A8C3AHJ3_CYCLU